MLYLQYLPDEIIEPLLNQAQSFYELQDNPLSQEIANDFFRKFNGSFETLDERIAELAIDIIGKTEMKYTATGIFSFIEKGSAIEYNGILLILPKILVCEEYGDNTRT